MRIFTILASILFLGCQSNPEGKELENIRIVRDAYGVPHIFGDTDADVAYGLAWVQCEDQFITLQELMAACKGKLGEIKGKEGLVADFGIKFMGLQKIAHANYEKEVTGKFKEYLESFVAGINAYAELHKEEVLIDGLFPITGQDVIVGYLLGNLEVSHAGKDLAKILNGSLYQAKEVEVPRGSNGIAISKKKTNDNKTYLAINSHQPLEGWYSWYEAHLVSKEGLNILGGTFAGGICIFHGVNQNLGWAHTVNHADFSDVYSLEMHPTRENFYKFDDQWLELKENKHTAWLKLTDALKIPISQTNYESVYGPTFKTDDGVFAWNFVVGRSIKMAEQWYLMNKASNFNQFKKALALRGISTLNFVYADRQDTIYYLSNGGFPKRNPTYDWSGILPGNTSKTLWGDATVSLDSLPQVLNPKGGWVFNTNNTPFSAADSLSNFKESGLNRQMGYQSKGLENNRSLRFLELIKQYNTLSYEDFKRIKYDLQYPTKMMRPTAVNLEDMMHLDPSAYPDIADAIILLNQWNRKSDMKNTTAALYIISWLEIDRIRTEEGRVVRGGRITEEDAVAGIRKAKKELLTNFGTLEPPLAEMQRLIRGDVNLPIAGMPDVLAAMYSKPTKDKIYKAFAGESYIALVRFGESGVEIESVNTFGASEKPESPYYTSEMKLFATQQLKKMTLDTTLVLQNAKRIYHPKRIP